MTMRVILTCCLLTIPTLAQTKPEQPATPPGIAWENDYEKALKKAKREGRPLMVTFVLGDEPANEEMMEQHFRDSEIIEFSRRFVCLVCCPNVEEDIEGARTDGDVGPTSKKLGAASSKEIRAIEHRARNRLLEAYKVSCPQFLFLSPDTKKVLLRHVWMLPKRQLLMKMKLAWRFHSGEGSEDLAKENELQVNRLIEQAQHKDADVRRPALSSLAELDDPRIMDFLREQTKVSAGQQQRLEAIFFCMGQANNATVLPYLEYLLRDRDALVRLQAAVAIGKVGLIDAIPSLQGALKRESQDRVRSHLLRAIAACTQDPAELEKLLLPYFRAKGEAESVTLLHLASQLDGSQSLRKQIQKKLRSGRPVVRVAAYVAIGTHGYSKLTNAVRLGTKREKNEVRAAAAWAWERLGGPTYEGSEDPESVVSGALPDSGLWDGTFSAR